VLISRERHTWLMIGFLLISLLVLAGPLAFLAGVDSRADELSRHRRPGIR
jgi:hypothetical protein